MSEQSFANHGRYVPLFHFFVLPVFVANVVHSIYRVFKTGFSFETIFGVLLAVALLVLCFYARLFALAVQDRLIRLEERMRLERLFPEELRTRVPEFTCEQLVALRFASDQELPELARRVLDEKLADRKSIKRMVKQWRPDYQRA